MSVFMGIDPGASGGIAVVHDGIVEAASMPKTERDVWEWINRWSSPEMFAVIEKVGGFIGVPHPGSAMFKFGMSCGGLRMALTAAGVPYEDVTPQKWQKALGIPVRKKTESKGDHKNVLKAAAQRIFPKEKITLATADALLLVEYCRRKRTGTL